VAHLGDTVWDVSVFGQLSNGIRFLRCREPGDDGRGGIIDGYVHSGGNTRSPISLCVMSLLKVVDRRSTLG
jgi:hypothetical protein